MCKVEFLLCPVCKSKTLIKLRPDTVLENFPLCKLASSASVIQMPLVGKFPKPFRTVFSKLATHINVLINYFCNLIELLQHVSIDLNQFIIFRFHAINVFQINASRCVCFPSILIHIITDTP